MGLWGGRGYNPSQPEEKGVSWTKALRWVTAADSSRKRWV